MTYKDPYVAHFHIRTNRTDLNKTVVICRVIGDYTLSFQSTSCLNSNKCNPLVKFTSHWYANDTQTGITLDMSADDDDGDFQGSGKTFLCSAGEDGGYNWL